LIGGCPSFKYIETALNTTRLDARLNCDEVVDRLKAYSDSAAVAGMARFGINPSNTLGVSIPVVRKIAKEIGRDHRLAQELWASQIHEARILAAMIDEPQKATAAQMEGWVKDFDSWDVCDQCCSNLFDKTPFAYQKAFEWSSRKEEFVKRAAFALIASLAVHDKQAKNSQFQTLLPLIERESVDDRNFVRKAVNWALRQIGKRNLALNRLAVKTAKQILKKESSSARWIASDAIRELTSASVRRKISKTR
jgi:3-methyladenine DNA glycosylase AlkD